MRVGKVTLTPTVAPPKRGAYGTQWREVVETFLRSGEECVRVDLEGPTDPKRAHSMYDALKKNIRPGEPARAAVRDGKVYLVREVK